MLRVERVFSRCFVLVAHLLDEAIEGNDVSGHLILVTVTHGANTTSKRDGHSTPKVFNRLKERQLSIVGYLPRIVGDEVDSFRIVNSLGVAPFKVNGMGFMNIGLGVRGSGLNCR